MSENSSSNLQPPMRIRNVEELGDFVRQERNHQGMTQADILGMANTGNRFIVELENGKSTVRLDKVLAVLDVLGLELLIQKKGNR